MALLRTNCVRKIFSNILSRSLSFQTAGGQQTTHKKYDLEHKVAVVTGGASGIGYSIAKELLKEGLSALAVIDVNKKKLDETSRKLCEDFGQDSILTIEADVSDIEQMDSAFKNTVLYYHVIDLIINNAGVMDDTKWENELKTNLNGSVIGTLLGMQYMSKSSQRSGGIIVNVGSIMSGILSCGFPVYTMTQFGIAAGGQQTTHKKYDLEHKVAVVTGGASGIGYSIAKELLKEGLSALAVIDVNKKKLDETSRKLCKDFGEDRILTIEADVSDIEQMDSAFKNTVLYYHVIDLIINNAGVMDDTKWENELKTNLNGSVIGTLLGMQYMSKSSQGSGGIIVNVGSIMSVIPSCGFPVYTMTQFGIAGFSKALGSSKLYERTGVKIFGYCPGLTNTKMLEDVSPKCINLNFATEFQVEIENCKKQTPDHVAKSLIDILEEAKPGSLWVVENANDPYEVELRASVKKKNEHTEERYVL